MAVLHPVLRGVDSHALDSGKKEERGSGFDCGISDYAAFMLAGDGSMHFTGKIL